MARYKMQLSPKDNFTEMQRAFENNKNEDNSPGMQGSFKNLQLKPNANRSIDRVIQRQISQNSQ